MSEVEADKVDNHPFNWGKKRGVGGKRSEVQFYESFTYDGVDYTLYDCVYMYKEGEPGPYVGMLIKIWENPDKTKKVKLQWFFQPYEIVNWLGNVEVSTNEIFLASGKGVGLANVNPLEAIAGKCNVVCISKDSRNRQPSPKELEKSDYIFYRTFDVEHFSISDRLDDKVGGLKVEFVFNKEDGEQPADTLGLGSIKMDGVDKPALELLGKGSSEIAEVEGKLGGTSIVVLKRSEDMKGPVSKSKYSPRGESASGSPEDLREVATSSGRLETVPGEITSRHRDSQEDAKVKVSADEEDSLVKLKSSPKGKSYLGAPEDSSRVITSNGRQETVSGEKTKRPNFDSLKDDAKVSKVGSNRLLLEEPIKHAKESDPVANGPSKKSVVEDSVKPLETVVEDSSRVITSDGRQKTVSGEKTKRPNFDSHKDDAKVSKVGSNRLLLKEPIKHAKESDPKANRPSKISVVEDSVKPLETVVEDSSRVITTNGRQETVSGDKTKRPNFDSHKDEAKVSKVGSNRLLLKEPIKHAKESDPKANRPSKKSVVEDSVKPLETVVEDSSRVITSNGRQETVSGDETKRPNFDSHKDDAKVSKVGSNRLVLEEPIKHVKESDPLANRPSKKSVVEDSVKPLENMNTNNSQKMVHGNNTKGSEVVSYENKTKRERGTDSLGLDKGVRSTKNMAPPEERLSKKARVENSVMSNENKHSIGVQKCTNAAGNSAKDSTALKNSAGIPVTDAERSKSKVSAVQFENDRKQKIDEKRTKVANSQLTKVASGHSRDKGMKKSDIIEDKKKGDIIEVTRRPDDERSKWFRDIPWEERLKNAHEQRMLVLLSNLDPECSSGEVEDIIWHVFKETCAAKRVQCSAISSPHSGQAFIILKNTAAAERIVQELYDGCLLLPNGRPLVGSLAPPLNFPGKQSSFFGHLTIEKLKHHMSKEKEAVSTSHCSQPNTVEYEMAMEWVLLQSRADSWWARLYKQQGQELRKLQSNLKTK